MLKLADRYVLIINESKSLTEAARKIGISQPALSLNIGNLEKTLGYQIFDRKTLPMSLTPAGRLYVDYLKQMNRIGMDYEKKLADMVAPQKQQLIVGAPSSYETSILADTAARFYAGHKECILTIREAPLLCLTEQTQSGSMDCFISTTDRLPLSMVTEKLKSEHIYICIPGEWEIKETEKEEQVLPGSKKRLPDYSFLDGLPYISLLPDMPLQMIMDRFFGMQNIRPETVMLADKMSVGLRLAAKGVGFCAASEEALESVKEESRLRCYRLPELPGKRELYIARNEQSYLSNSCRQFIEELKETIRK